MCNWQWSSVSKVKKKEISQGITARPPPYRLEKPTGSPDLILAGRVTPCSPIKALYLADSPISLKHQLSAG